MASPLEKFQLLLRELFQFDSADLDFGIYRIMNQKRALLESFITKDLRASVTKELSRGVLKEQGELAEHVARLAAKIREDIGDDAIDADGNLNPKHAGIKLCKQYQELKTKAEGLSSDGELEASVYNHLWTFFSRYYDNGDFLSTRRYSRREKYAIPYNGEEVYLHWANRDQYYIKTGENFTDYQWKAGEVAVLFKLVQADTEKDNVKSDKKRVFLPRLDEVEVDKKTITIPFEYRGLTEQELITYGKKNQQEAIIAAALESLPRRKALKDAPAVLTALLAEYRKTERDESVSRLEHHLRRYTAKNTRDYFIHKDLDGFLTRELDFYLKNEVLQLDDLASGGEERAEGWFQLLHTIRNVGSTIIAFLAQIENFQKRLFEKRKFITETHYCFTLDRVPKALYPAILKNKAQIEEWKKLYSIEELKGYSSPLKPAFLENWPALMIDTAFFADDPEFIDTLLAAQKDLEESLGGLLVHSENFQALNLLQARFKEQVKCVYIDPPYNTTENAFIYKNEYKHSSWLSMIIAPVSLSLKCLVESGVLNVAIDDTEHAALKQGMNHLLGYDKWISVIAVEVNPAGQNIRPGVPARSHDYCFIYAPYPDKVALIPRALTDEEKESYSESDGAGGFWLWDNLRRRGGNSRPEDRPNQWYPLFVDEINLKVSLKKFAGSTEVWPIDPKGIKRIWRVSPEGFQKDWDAGNISVHKKSERFEVVKKSWMPEGKKPKTLWYDSRYSATTHGTKLLISLFGESPFSYPKSIHLVQDTLALWLQEGDIVLDYFGGSGTTAHAVINLNSVDGGDRKYIVAEVGDHFNGAIKPRVMKVVFSNDWKDGKPIPPSSAKATAGGPKTGKSSGISHAFKYIRLESYEDALGNISFAGGQDGLVFDADLLRYQLEFETRESETLLNVEKLAAPFSYRLDIMENGERKTKPVDLPETFNYLLGLKVSRRTVHCRGKSRYLVVRGVTNPHGEGGERSVAVIWRDVTGWKAADFKADADFVAKEKLADGADQVLVNADSVIPGAQVLDALFKERMFAPVGV